MGAGMDQLRKEEFDKAWKEYSDKASKEASDKAWKKYSDKAWQEHCEKNTAMHKLIRKKPGAAAWEAHQREEQKAWLELCAFFFKLQRRKPICLESEK